MLTFTVDQVAALGPGILFPDGDSLYITNNAWLLIVSNVEAHIPLEVLSLVANAPSGQFVDWRVLAASRIHPEIFKYTPERGVQSLDLYINDYEYRRVSMEGTRALVESYSDLIWGDSNYKLNELFAQGHARAVYTRKNLGDRRRIATEPSAQTYQFNLDNRIAAVQAPWFRAFYELGFEINCPTYGSKAPAVYGLRRLQDAFDIIGFLAATYESGIRTTSDGRVLGVDATQVSWLSYEEALSLLVKFRNYTPGDTTKVCLKVLHSATSDLLLAVSALRWQGFSDEDINKMYDEGREEALVQWKELLENSAYKLAQAPDDRRLLAEVHNNWQHAEDLEQELGMPLDKAYISGV